MDQSGFDIQILFFYSQKLAEKLPLFYTWQNEGDVILTSSYHQGFNEGANINIAMAGFQSKISKILKTLLLFSSIFLSFLFEIETFPRIFSFVQGWVPWELNEMKLN